MTLLFETSCRKPTLPESDKNLKSELQSGVGFATIDIRDITSKLPKTILYNCGDSLKMYLGRTQWEYEQDYLQLRIPINASNTLFLYGTKYYDSTNTNAYLVQFVPDAGNHDSLYSGKQLWIDLQTWTGYGLRYVNDSVVASLKPIALADSNWEQCMLEHGMFEIDSKGKIRVKNNKDNLTSGGPYDCWHEGGKFWSNLGATFTKIITGLGEIFDDSGSNGNSGGGGSGGNWQITIGGWTNGGAGAPSGTPSGGFGNGNGSPPGNPPLTGGSNFALPTPDENVQVEQPDENGFYPSRIAALEIYLQANPYGLLDCNDLQANPNFWSLWQEIGSYEIPQSVIQRMHNIRNDNSPSYTEDNFKILDLYNAYGGVVNCDFFSIHITQLPNNSNGVTMSPIEFLEYFRTHINDFSNNIAFEPYFDYVAGSVNINDSIKFFAPYQESLGALVHIEIPFDEGSVIESDYSPNTGINGRWYFKFTTIKAPIDYNHPVSGNREFGIYHDNNNGGYTFYISGVDRITDPSNSFINFLTNNYIFDNADNLWHSILLNIISFVNITGSASSYGPYNEYIRPDINGPLFYFLTGEYSIYDLMAALNCP